MTYPTIRISITGLSKTIANLKSLTKILDSSEARHGFEQLGNKSEEYWRNNVYRYFDTRQSMGLETSGRLGRSISISVTHKSVLVKMKRLMNGDVDYGRLLRTGFGSSPGKYIPAIDRRIRTGTHPGYSARTKWIPWKREFREYMLMESKDTLINIVREWKRSRRM